MKNQACEPCKKRRVRCDRGEPCSNCKRRKQDHCSYPDDSPFDRIRKLEALVQKLGGDPEGESQQLRSSREASSLATPISQAPTQHDLLETPTSTSIAARSNDPVILEDNGQSMYLESRAWHGLHDKHQTDNGRDVMAKSPFLSRDKPDAFGELFSKSQLDLATSYPSDQDIDFLWNTFEHRVHPLIRISFSHDLDRLRSAASNFETRHKFTNSEHAFVFSLLLVSIVSLSDEECDAQLHQSRSKLLAHYRRLCEEALSRTNLFCLTEIIVLKALTVYIMAGVPSLSLQSLWSVMGLTLRNAEKLGLHRDGVVLGLSPAVTEDRRRLWWQLQHLDLILAVISGLTPMSMMADWDVKLPLNIEDDDINPNMSEFPQERKGLTSVSYCRFTYWILSQQRAFFRDTKDRFELSWQSNKAVPTSQKDTLVQQIEEGLNKNFIQYCDPIVPTHILIQITARSLPCALRLRRLQPLVFGGDPIDEKQREELISTSIQSLGYNVALHSQPSIKHLQWWTSGHFSWHALMCVLIEASQQEDMSKTQRIWDLLSEVYSSNLSLSQLSEDRRKSYAAELVVAAWKARQNKAGSKERLIKPQFVLNLESRLAELHADPIRSSGIQTMSSGMDEQTFEPILSEGFLTEQDLNEAFDLDFQDIDWSFWNSLG